MPKSRIAKNILLVLIGLICIAVLYIISRSNYLLFHSIAEMFAVVVIFAIFAITWNSRRFSDNAYFLFIGIACLFIGALELVHTLAYRGMGVFPGYGSNLATQLWIAVRYLESLSLLIAPLFIQRKINIKLVFAVYFVATALIILSIFTWNIFPQCYIDGVGLTPFKVISEYVISLILVGAISLLLAQRRKFSGNVVKFLVASMLASIASEMFFTLYTDVYGVNNMIGHLLQIVAFYLIYKSLIEIALAEPYQLLFHNLKKSETELKQTVGKLTRSNADLTEFAYVASHDLQEPLRMVSSYLQLIERRYRDKLDNDGIEFMTFAVDGANRMQKMITDLLIFSRVGTRGKPFAPTDCEIILSQALLNLETSIQESQAVVTHDPLPNLMADSTQMVQLFQNLIGNAIKFRKAQAPQVHISARLKADDWEFSVRDNGIGIEPHYYERIFVVFQRLHGKGEYPGTGIGLAVCKKVVERHGGQIWVESEPGQGSTFSFTIPLG